jgi:hypothetical protein
MLPGCSNAQSIIDSHMCTLAGACHDNSGSAANFSLVMMGPDWGARLVGAMPRGGGVTPSKCASTGMPYIVAGSHPATGLLLAKLSSAPPCGDRMPLLGLPLSDPELACVQAWADKLAAGP